FREVQAMTRWDEVLDSVAGAVAPGPRVVVVDGAADVAEFADRLAQRLESLGQTCRRLSDEDPRADEAAWRSDAQLAVIAIADGPTWRAWPPGHAWDVVIWLRTPSAVVPEPHRE